MRKFLSLKLPIVLTGLLVANTAAWGHSKTDLITVSTGDTLTGGHQQHGGGQPIPQHGLCRQDQYQVARDRANREPLSLRGAIG